MSGFLRSAALTAAAAVAAAGLTSASSRIPASHFPPSAPPSSSPSTPIGPVAVSGHLALVRAHPGLRELDAMLTPASFLVDGTQALLAGALRCPPIYPEMLRQGREYLAAQIQSAESEGHAAAEQAIQFAESEDHAVAAAEQAIESAESAAEQAASARTHMALLDAREGRLDDARDAMVRLAAERPGDTTLRLFAAALCRVLGRHEEGAQWLRDSAVTDLSHLDHKIQFVQAVIVATVGSAPRAVAGSEELVLVTTLGLLELSMWSIFAHGDLTERLQVLAMMAFLRGVVARKLRRDDDGPAPMQGS